MIQMPLHAVSDNSLAWLWRQPVGAVCKGVFICVTFFAMEKDLIPEYQVEKKVDHWMGLVAVVQDHHGVGFNWDIIPSRNDMQIARQALDYYLKYSDDAIDAHNEAINIIHHGRHE